MRNALKIDCGRESRRIEAAIRASVRERLKRRGVVVALSGGVDSSVVGALCVQALGRERVLGLLLPEKDSSGETRLLGQRVVEHLGIKTESRDITDLLEVAGCYKYRDEAIQSVVPDYRPSYRCKIVLPSLLDREQLRVFSVVVESPEGRRTQARLPLKPYLQIVAATNFKQRVRKMLEYFHADRLNYAVVGTPNRQEYDQGFFVKLGDGAADVKPIAHLYKTQVYQMAECLRLPREICERPPTTDTYSLPQDQEEFYFSVPYYVLDFCLYAKDHHMLPDEAARTLLLTTEQVERVYKDIDTKRRTTRYQHMAPLLIERPAEVVIHG
ncbi:MAG: NAD(+) synthase [Sedimentisphaerales bacterium]|nr:NAD(+) synthase [Sedimentisphaerales bacterium]